jgi:NitT/TauT family transport system permease protein
MSNLVDVQSPIIVASPDPAPVKRRGPRKSGLARMQWWQPLVVFVILIGIWYSVALYYDKVQGLKYLVPYPSLVFNSLFLDEARRPALLQATGNTIEVMFIGLAAAIVIGMLWAIVMSQAKWAERSLFPYAVILQCIPILALVPLIGSLFGYELLSRVIVTTMIALFPMVSNTLFGLQSADKAQRELFKLQGASRWTVLTKLQFPSALPLIFVGLRNAAGLSVIGAIVGDQFFQRGAGGLGVLIQLYNSRLQGSDTFATIIASSLLGVIVFLLFGLLGRLAIGKWYDYN